MGWRRQGSAVRSSGSDPAGSAVRIGNCSGFYGDRLSAMHEMLTGGELDYLTGDYLAELTMLILGRDRMKNPDTGYAKTFLRQLEECLGIAKDRGVRIVTNAGGLNPAGLAAAVRTLAETLGIAVSVAHVEGDDVLSRAEEFGFASATSGGGALVTANAYLGAWGIVDCLDSGADIVVTGRVTDASVIVGPAAAHFGWHREDHDSIEAPRGMSIYGQEKDNATWALSKMNMILHGNEIAEIEKGDTITSPKFTKGDHLETFDYIVMNPPFSVKSWNNGLENDYGRFEYGRPPEKNGDYAFLLHALTSLKSTGKAAVILPHGVLFRSHAEATIRTRLLKQGFIKGIIGLPANLFYGTGIPACIVILDKENAHARTGVLMIDASQGFIKDGNKNRLRSQDIHKIVDTFNKQIEIDRYSRMVPMSEIADPKNDYNLNIPRYIDSSEPEDLQDLSAHLHGGIPDRDLDALQAYWDAFPQLRSQIFTPNRPGYSDLTIDVAEVQQAILDAPGFHKLRSEATDLVDDWFATHRDALAGITADTKPNDLIAAIGDDLLSRFKSMPLLDEYDVYEQLMSYWHESMHDDVYLIMADGWQGAAKPRLTINDKERKLTEEPDLVIGSGKNAQKYKMDLIPPALIVARYFADEQAKVDELTAAAEEATRAVEEYTEVHAVEDGLLADAMDDDKISKALVAARLKAIKTGGDPGEIKALQCATKLYNADAAAKKAVKDAQADLDLATLKKYGDLTEGDVQTLALDDKWRTTVTSRAAVEVDALTRALVGRIEQLGERYAETVDTLDAELKRLEATVAGHLAAMGVEA